jgi:hypothetical protein
MDAPSDLDEFRPLPSDALERLIEKGRREAADLDRAIRSQFEMTAADGAARLR